MPWSEHHVCNRLIVFSGGLLQLLWPARLWYICCAKTVTWATGVPRTAGELLAAVSSPAKRGQAVLPLA